MADDGCLDSDFEHQAVSIITEAFDTLRELSPELSPLVAVEYGSNTSLPDTATLRANQEIHPAEPLMAAEALFGVALPVIVGLITTRCPETSVVAIARTVHYAVWRRFPRGAIGYVEVLRSRLSSAHIESRRRVALDLHDRIAHGIAAGIHRVELSAMADGTSLDGALGEAVDIFRSALTDVQDLAFELSQRVGDRFLDDSILEYLANTYYVAPVTKTHVFGEHVALSSSVSEEAFTVVLEALRNGRTHATGATHIDVKIRWSPTSLNIDVEDDGPGFDPKNVHGRAIGLAGMKERSEAIGGRLQVETSEHGTRVSFLLPIGITVMS